MVLDTNTINKVEKMRGMIQRGLIANREEEISEILENLKVMFSKHQITKEEFAVLYGYTYLAEQQLLKMDDIKFILANTLVKHQRM
jgi:hypothetical protein